MHIAAVTIIVACYLQDLLHQACSCLTKNIHLLRSRMFLCTNQIKKLGSLYRRPRIEVNVLVYATRQFIAHVCPLYTLYISTHVTIPAILHRLRLFHYTGTCFCVLNTLFSAKVQRLMQTHPPGGSQLYTYSAKGKILHGMLAICLLYTKLTLKYGHSLFHIPASVGCPKQGFSMYVYYGRI